MTSDANRQLTEVLEEIRALEGAEGPTISDVIGSLDLFRSKIKIAMPLEWQEDIVVGEIGRACNAKEIRIRFVPDRRILSSIIATVEMWIFDHSAPHRYRYLKREGPNLALTAAIAYRDVLKGVSE